MKSSFMIESGRLLAWCDAVEKCIEYNKEYKFVKAAQKMVKPARRFLFWTLKAVSKDEALEYVKTCGGDIGCSHCLVEYTGGAAAMTAKELKTAALCSNYVNVSVDDAHYMKGWTFDEDFKNIFGEKGYR